LKILIDECIDWSLGRDIVGHEVKTARQMGWSSIKNGELLALAEREFDVFVTVDRNLSFQQKLPAFGIAVIVMRARSNRLADLRPLALELLTCMPNALPGAVTYVGTLV
jgi:predicted nuclease of predicted toxin-antitoxin system